MDQDLQQSMNHQSALHHLNDSESLNDTRKSFSEHSSKYKRTNSEISDNLKKQQIWTPSLFQQKRGDGLSDQDLQCNFDQTSMNGEETKKNIDQQIQSNYSADAFTKKNKQNYSIDSLKPQSEIAIESDFKKFRDQQRKKTYVSGQNPSQFDLEFQKKKKMQEQQEEGEEGQMGLIQFLRQKQETLNKQYTLFLRTINIKKFMNTMKRKSRKLLFKYLTLQHFQIIGDNASDYDFYRFNNYLYYKVIYQCSFQLNYLTTKLLIFIQKTYLFDFSFYFYFANQLLL